jgi:ribosomal protein S18 acetylase RimI-like enzyme
MAEVRYRPAEAGDWPEIARLVGREPAEGEALARYVHETYDPGLAWVALLGEGVVGAVVAGGRPVTAPGGAPGAPGAPEAAERAPEGRIVFVGVAPGARRRGIGRGLLDLALNGLRSPDLRRVMADVDGTEVEALALFRRAGFDQAGQTMTLSLPEEAVAALRSAPPDAAPGAGPPDTVLRPLALDDLPHLSGLLIQLGIERAQAPHDDLPALTPAQLEAWLMRPATVAYALWEAADPTTPLGLAWATRRPEDAVLRFVAVQDDVRRQGLGRALLAAVVGDLGPRPLRASVRDPGEEGAFFRRLGFVAERITHHLATDLHPGDASRGSPLAGKLQ